MTLLQFVSKVDEMRTAQKNYYAYKVDSASKMAKAEKQRLLVEAKQLENQVDEYLKAHKLV